MDERGRLRLPAPIVMRNDLDQSGAKFMLALGMGGHLVLYPANVWESTCERVLKLDDFDEEQSQFKDMFFQMLDTVDLDGNGRFQISSHLASAVGIDRDVVISGRGDRYYIWAKDVFEKQKPSGKDLRESAQKAFASYKQQTTAANKTDEGLQAA
jgi:MraZ protein